MKRIDHEIIEALYDPKKLAWKQFIAAHKNWRTPAGLLDLKKIAAHWKAYKAGKAYDPKKQKGSGIPSSWYNAMLKGIQNSSDVRDPGKIVRNIWKRLTPKKRAEIIIKSKNGGSFVYDLPLPEDHSTRGSGTVRVVKPFDLAEVQVNVAAKDYDELKKTEEFDIMKRQDGTLALVKRCKSQAGNCNIFVDKR